MLQDRAVEWKLERRDYLLARPYVLSFATLRSIRSLQMTVRLSSGESRTAEVVPLPVYSDESEEAICAYLKRAERELAGFSLAGARAKIEPDIAQRPFATSPLLTAIDLFTFDPPDVRVDELHFVLPGSTAEGAELRAIAARCAESGQTLKVKLTGKPGTDLSALSELDAGDMSGCRIRLDANQAFSAGDAASFLDGLTHSSLLPLIDYVEQPMAADDWVGHEVLIRSRPAVPVMLDESIVVAADVKRAAEIGATHVKLKLFKQGGIRELIALAREANALGLKVVLGNGVATWVSNRVEIGIFAEHPQLFLGALEANGFLKIAGDGPAAS